jgi:hypothetical protein
MHFIYDQNMLILKKNGKSFWLVFLPDMGVFIQFFEAIKMACNLTPKGFHQLEFIFYAEKRAR